MEKVSIIIPAYNKARLTVKTVESALNQSYSNVEVIVVDDGSTDDTRACLSQFGNKINYIFKENGGCCSARNFGFKNAKGEYVGFLDCDDLYAEDKVERCVDYLRTYPEFGLVHTAAYFIDGTSKTVGFYSHRKSNLEGRIFKRLLFGNYICNSTPIIRRECLEQVGGFDESIFVPADWDMWLRIAQKYQIGYIQEPLTKYRVSGNYTLQNLDQAKEDELQVLENAMQTHSQLRFFLKKKAFSSLFLRYAQTFLIKGDLEKMRADFISSLKYNPLNLKAIAFFFYYLVARKNLIFRLKRKILRFAE